MLLQLWKMHPLFSVTMDMFKSKRQYFPPLAVSFWHAWLQGKFVERIYGREGGSMWPLNFTHGGKLSY